MNGKELVRNALVCKEVERIPWVPFVGCHAAHLMGISAETYFKTADRIVDGARLSRELYEPDGLPVLFDLQVEAEALGCGVQFSPENPPAVMSHPLEGNPDLSALKVPGPGDGRFPQVMEAARRIVAEMGDSIAVYGLITGPFTLGLHLRGTDIFFDMVDNPEYVQQLMAFCTKVCKATAKIYLDAGVDVVALVDPMTSQISSANFAEFVSPAATEIFAFIKEQGGLASFFVCGNAKRNIEEMCKCQPHNVSIDENIPLDYVKEVAGRYGVSIGGNIQLTVTLLLGNPADAIRDAANCSAIGGKRGFILSPGCDMPFATPQVNVQAIAAYVHGRDGEFLAQHSGKELEIVEFHKPDYASQKTVDVDVITLDSDSCAPCQYMMEAVRAAAEGLPGLAVAEHKVKTPEGIGCMLALGVKNIPTIVVDGETKYISIIPEVAELRATFETALRSKALL